MSFWFGKFQSRKFWVFIIGFVSAVAGLVLGDLTFPQFMMAIIALAGTYQAGEGIADRGNRQ
jgi:hypothetical protein